MQLYIKFHQLLKEGCKHLNELGGFFLLPFIYLNKIADSHFLISLLDYQFNIKDDTNK